MLSGRNGIGKEIKKERKKERKKKREKERKKMTRKWNQAENVVTMGDAKKSLTAFFTTLSTLLPACWLVIGW